MKTLFIILFLSEGPEAVWVTSATFLCCTPATNTDVAGPGAGCLRFVYLGCKALENLSLSCTNGHLALYWELHSHCLFCISSIDLFNFLRLMSLSFRNCDFFYLTKAGFHFSKFPFCHTNNAKGSGIWDNCDSKKTESNAHLGCKCHAINSFLLKLL